MSVNVSDFPIQRLNEWGIRRIYGFPSDGVNGIIGAIGRAGEKVDYVQVRHEEMSAFMARVSSRSGCLPGYQRTGEMIFSNTYKFDHQ
jgi:thiamine pyrophosphate-dependent acetolactate synthase large subunit-like protein